MKLSKSVLGVCAAVLLMGAVSTAAFAAAYGNPAEAVAGVTGKSVAEVTEEWQNGKPFGTIAAEAGKLDEFQAAMLEMQKEALNERVKAGNLTQAQADEILAGMEARQAVCGGMGYGCGRGYGAGYGNGGGYGRGAGVGACITR